MYENSDYTLDPRQKIEILYRLFNKQNISDYVDRFDTNDVIGLQNFLWETTAEFGILCHGKNFTRKNITRKMTSTVKYQQQQGCSERIFNCKAAECIHSNSECARKKIKEQINVMAESIHEFIRIEQKKEEF